MCVVCVCVTVFVHVSGPRMESLKMFVREQFEGAHVVEEQAATLKFWLPLNSLPSPHGESQQQPGGGGLKLSTVFETIEGGRQKYRIEDYGIGQPTLEQVFIEISKSQSNLHGIPRRPSV